MTDDERARYSIGGLHASAPQGGRITAEELARTLARYQAITTETAVTVGQELRQREERDATERAVHAEAEQERRAIAVYDADARRRRGDGNISFGQSVATVGAATAIGIAFGGPKTGLLAAGAGWLLDRLVQGK